jgi:hypothetical protein
MGEKIHADFWLENLKARNRLQHRGVDERKIIKYILNKLGGEGGVDCINLAQDKD